MEPELIADYQCVCGENPLWHPTEKRLYWLDIETARMFRYDPASGHHEKFYEGDTVGGFTFQSDGALLLFMAKGAVKLWRNGEITELHEHLPGELDSRFNDVIADPAGRVFCGTMTSDSNKGTLYRLDSDGRIAPVLHDVGCSNGMGFTPDGKTMYFTDSFAYEIYRFDYDAKTGAISNREIFVKGLESDGFPDGMTVDAEGCVWSAHWDGSCLIRYAPDGSEVLRIGFPAKKVSSCVFGGEDCRDLYVTTAGGDQKATDGEGAGALYRLRPGVQGVPEFPSRIGR
jgi:sugar lactone lactonase YvrE